MSKMKHLLRKLHIGGGGGGPGPAAIGDPHRLGLGGEAHRPVSSPSSSLPPTPIPVQPPRNPSPAPAESRPDEFSFLEEEFQVQLALAISASSADHVEPREDPDESAQIDAAKRISLGCSAAASSGDNSGALVELMSLQYWSYNVVSYDEKVMDGFYDVHCIQSSTSGQGKMPSLVDLEAVSVSANVDYEVTLVNRIVDPDLQQLEKMAMALAEESQASKYAPIVSGLVQKIADLVVSRMGGPVLDADEMVKRWTSRSCELQNLLNSIILPLGRLDIGLSRHRALLFKVLADRIDLPCKLVKGSYYTGTDEGAVNLIRIENGSEYIIDLMGAPGTLIPAEVPSINVPYSELARRSSAEISPVLLDEKSQDLLGGADFGLFPQFVDSKPCGLSASGEKSKRDVTSSAERNQTERFEHDFGKLLPSLCISHESQSGISEKATPAQKMKVKNVSKYVISAAKNPEFAQKLHAVLLESGASPPPDLFSDAVGPSERKMIGNFMAGKSQSNPDTFSLRHEQNLYLTEAEPTHNARHGSDSKCCAIGLAEKLTKLETNVSGPCYAFSSDANSEGFVLVNRGFQEQTRTDALVDTYQTQTVDPTMSGNDHLLQERCGSENDELNPVLGDAAEWDIKWEDLQIGERIGIGSYGEVYRADWNGTEVAVKKFLDQDVSGEALAQFKAEVEIMLRLRHPNVVLFMGAVTRPPHFSILTEFLPRGSLYRLLHRPNPLLDEKRRMKMALDVAKGMNYLHTSHPTIVHRDLKSPNLLVDRNWVVKVCDFGLSRTKHHTFLSSKSTAGTPEWMAPEVLRNEPANEKCDVYSFGVILWELTTMCIPWKGLNPMQVVGAVGFQNRRLEIPEEVNPTVAQIIRECWETEPHRRPSFTQLMSRLKRLQRLVADPMNTEAKAS